MSKTLKGHLGYWTVATFDPDSGEMVQQLYMFRQMQRV